MTKMVYKVCSSAAWSEAERAGFFAGSADDCRDGFIHLSTADQLEGTLLKFFSGQPALVLLGFRALDLGPVLKWEPSRGGMLFPHLYGRLPTNAAIVRYDLRLDAAGHHILPGDLDR